MPTDLDLLAALAGSCRSKNVERRPRTPAARLKSLSRALRGRTGRPNRRPWDMPAPSLLPPEFIRLDPWEMEYLFMLAHGARRGILETGRFNGGSVFVMACANKQVPIHSIDIAPRDDAQLRQHMTRAGIGANVELIVGDSQAGRYEHVGEIDLLFVDGDHSYGGCLRDLENWWPRVVDGGHVVLHDCYFGREVPRAVIDFLGRQRAEAVRPPYIPASHWHLPAGSLAHLVKRG
jgi:predicted O-methyltransferase YrrM